MSSLHFSSSQVDGVCPLPGPAAVQPCFQEPRSKGRETSPSTHDAPRVREGGHQWGKCWCPSAGCNSGGFREEVTPHRPPLSHSYQGPLGQDGKGPSEAWSRTHEGPKGGVTFKSKKQAGGEQAGGELFLHSRCQRDSLGLSPEQMEVGFPNQSHCNSPRQSPPWAHGWEDCKTVQKTNLLRRLPRRLVSHSWWCPRNRQWSYFLLSDEDGGCWKTQVPVTQPERMCPSL